jgi:glycerol-1-phosphate dehydrogenase [NAD(P)+]
MPSDERVLADAVRQAQVTREVAIAPGALSGVVEVAARHFPGVPVVVVADRNTFRAAGERALAAFAGEGAPADLFLFEERRRLKPLVEHSRRLAERLRCGAVPVAVGSGVINDVVKYAAALAAKPYLCITTAASMDGYAASGAALLDQGFKRTFACAPPVAILVDTDVLAAAPPEMAAWGYGDLVGKLVAGADWMLADALGEEAIAARPYALVQDNLAGWLAEPARIAAGDRAAIRALAEGLLISGFAMQAHGNSRPASGSDHQFSHLWEMEGLTVAGVPAAHGACVGVGTVAMLALYEQLLAREITRADVERVAARPRSLDERLREVAAAFPARPIRDSALDEVRAKWAPAHRLPARLSRLPEVWPKLRQRLLEKLPFAADVQTWLRAVGAPASPADLDISRSKLSADYRRARFIRRRYTALDLLDDLDWLDESVDSLFVAGGFWRVRPTPSGRAEHAYAPPRTA